MQAFQEFTLQRIPPFAELGLADPDKFARYYADLNVSESTQPGTGKPMYVVTYARGHTSLDESAYPITNYERLFPPVGPRSMVYPSKNLDLDVFDADGALVELSAGMGSINEGIVRDLNHNGTIEVLEKRDTSSTACLSVYEVFGKVPLFAVAFDFEWLRNASGKEQPKWGFAIDDPEGDGIYDIVLGPKVLGEITPEVTFHWNTNAGTWTGPREGNNFRVLNPREVEPELKKLTASEAPKSDGADAQPEISITQLPPDAPYSDEKESGFGVDDVSKPYRYESLAKLSNEEILAYMGEGVSLWDLKRKQIPPALPAGFWKLDPKSATLRFVEQNRPSQAKANYRLAIDDLDGQRAPEEGTLTVSDGPSGCFSPGGAYEYVLRCSPGDSFLLVCRQLSLWYDVDYLQNNMAIDLRKVSLSYEEARHVFQVAWWLDRVRSKQVGETAGDGGAGSTSDGWASFRLESPQGTVEIEGTRYAGGAGRPVGVAEFNAEYTKTACLNLVVLLVSEGLPLHLGDRWNSMDVYPGQPLYDIPSLRTDYSPARMKRLKESVEEVLRLSIAGAVGPEVTREAVGLAGELVLTDLRPQMEKIAALLPPPGEREKRIKEMEKEIADWRARLGPEGTGLRDYYLRHNPPVSLPDPPAPGVIPGLEPLPGLEPSSDAKPSATGQPKPEQVPADPKFAALDALYAEKEQLEKDRPRRESAITFLRNEVEATSRWLTIYDDPQQLYELATGDRLQLFRAARRLRELDPARAIAAIEYWAKHEKDASAAQPLLKAIDDIREQLKSQDQSRPVRDTVSKEVARLARDPQAGSPEAQAAALISVALDKERDLEQRGRALELLVPAENPMKYPDPTVDEFLIGTLESKDRDTSYLWSAACKALALRGGGKHWERIAQLAGDRNFIGMSRFSDVLPALTIIAIKEPELYKARLRELLSPHLQKTDGMLNKVFWAAWLSGQRELKGELENLATSGPGDAEGTLGSSASNQSSAVQYRFHTARQVVAIWNEEDTLTRAKLLVALGVVRSELLQDSTAHERLRTELTQSMQALAPEQRNALREFVKWCGERSNRGIPPSKSTPEIAEWLVEAGSLFRAQ